MEGEEVLLGIVDLSIALIGFSSIVTALRRSKERAWSPQEINGLVFLATMSIGAILFSLLPFPLFHIGLTGHQIYSISSWAYLVYGIGTFAALFIRARTKGFPSRRPRVFNTFAFLSIIILVMMFMVASGNIASGLLGYYLLGVIWLLVLAFVQFLVFLSYVGFVGEEHSAESERKGVNPT
ncbi:MAG: hypothetical protein GTO14_23415 [Anaerolineales bacterium]|nr:hypothetical protein [Anaerolineales bacterium]